MKLLEMDFKHSQVWIKPTAQSNRQFSLVDTSADVMTTKLWQYYPEFASLGLRYYPLSDENEEVLGKLIISSCNEPLVQEIPEYCEIMLKFNELFPTKAPYHALDHWAPTSPSHFVEYLHLSHPCIERYCVDSMEKASKENTKYIIPQIIQCLKYQDACETVEKVLMKAARKDEVLAAYIYWQLNGEKTPPNEAFNPVIKRSGWKPPQDVGLWKVSDQIISRFHSSLTASVGGSLTYQVSYFDKIYEVASHLGSVAPENRVKELRKKLKDIDDPSQPVYVPFYPDKFIESIDCDSAITLPSAAKIPILVSFHTRTAEGLAEKVGCIFKVGDDCRQDVLALQVISMLEHTFKEVGLDLFLYTYGVITTDYECGLIEVVPNTKSRSGLGELSDCGLVQIFKQNFGEAGSTKFETARMNFIRSCAGYAVASFILWAKDRHNGNMLIDKDGHLIHIDFGFIFGISPGGNLGFENAGFKLSHEMCELIDPLGNRKSPEYKYFKKICIRGFLAARRRSQDIIDCVSLMSESGLPCFGYGKPVENLKKRLAIDVNTDAAAAYFEGVVDDAYMKWTTGFYDVIQFLQQGIPK
jgi:phosphatidylinositol 4-kinase